jgi:biopolymer transport protein TolQ|tara:strand:- start:921 stop:1610 length:690 start_codon:yes stop_codon:yes gene_type:complete
MNGNLSVIELILGASLIVQLVLLMLLAASVASWAIIMKKRKVLRQAIDSADEFEASFWSGGDLTSIYKSINTAGGSSTDMAAIFESGFREYRRLTQQAGQEPDKIIEGSMRAMRVAQMREMDRLDHQLATLATIGSTSPYVGLFGTVFGIMNSFRALGNVQSATLAMVAPGIAEALIATAMGLFAAIPAVIAYNRYADQVARIEVRYDTFREEFAAILQRSIASRQGSA